MSDLTPEQQERYWRVRQLTRPDAISRTLDKLDRAGDELSAGAATTIRYLRDQLEQARALLDLEDRRAARKKRAADVASDVLRDPEARAEIDTIKAAILRGLGIAQRDIPDLVARAAADPSGAAWLDALVAELADGSSETTATDEAELAHFLASRITQAVWDAAPETSDEADDVRRALLSAAWQLAGWHADMTAGEESDRWADMFDLLESVIVLTEKIAPSELSARKRETDDE